MRSSFRSVLKMECKKAVINKYFLIAVFCGICFTFLSALYCIENYRQTRNSLAEGGNPMMQAFGLYNTWIGGESISLGFNFFYTLLPLLAVLPYGWSYCNEKRAGYIKMVEIQTGRINYMTAKYIAVFLSGGTAVILPLIFNLLVVACFVPAVRPTLIYEMYYAVHYGSVWSELFFTAPVVYTMLYLLLDFIFAGLFAGLGFAVSFFVHSRIAAILIPYFLILALHYSRTLLYGRVFKELSPLNFLHATGIENVADPWIILVEMILFFVLPFGIVIGKGRKYEAL